MKSIFNLRRHSYLKTIGTFIIAIALIVGVVGCEGEGEAEYGLTVEASPAAGGTATDETGTSPYAEGTDVSIKAVANPGWEFDGWSASAGTFADEDAEETTFTMPGQDVTATANFVQVYDLATAANPAGGGTASDDTGTSPYRAGTVVDVSAVPTAPYQFFKWTAPAGSFADENAATTTFTMPAEDVTATANFVGPLDHATGYWVNYSTPEYIEEEVLLEDQFGAFHALVEYVEGFVIPAEKMYNDETAPIYNPDHCLTIYWISCEEDTGRWIVDIENQFGPQTLLVEGPYALAVPTKNGAHAEPLGLDHYLLYYVVDYTYLDEIVVELNDELLNEPMVTEVYEPALFANPVKKTHGTEVTEILNPDVHGALYYTDWGAVSETVDVVNQFGEQTLDIEGPYGLVVPSDKIAWEPVPDFDHFRMYSVDIGTQPYIGEWVQLQDQFLDEPLDAFVEWGFGFCNPVDKWHGEMYWESDWSRHLMVYGLYYEASLGAWEVTVTNQFGEDQGLIVTGPLALAVPTHKFYPDDWGPPDGLDHFLLYEVIDYTWAPDVPVDLYDQFTYEEGVWAYEPVLFANPVQKTFLDEVTEIQNPEWHMVFYNTPGDALVPTVEVGILNQFGEPWFTVTYPTYLGVPSAKTDWSPL